MKNVIFFFCFFIASLAIKAQDTIVINRTYLPAINKTLVFTPNEFNHPLSLVFRDYSENFYNCNPVDKGIIKKDKNNINGKYPLMFLMHGYSGSFTDWNNNINVQALADKYGFIIVCTEGYTNSWYLNSPIKDNYQYLKFFKEDLIPQIMKSYNIDKNNIFITGLSMGGHGALNIYLNNQKFFKAAGSMSGVLDIRLFPRNWEISKLLGTFDKTTKPDWDKNSAIENIKIDSSKKTNILLDCGTDDFAFPSNEMFYKKAKDMGVNIQFIRRPGNHNWEFWRVSVIKNLDYFKSLK